MRRVVITGAGSWNGFGAGVPAFLEALRSGRCAIGDMTLFSTSGFRTHRAAVAPTPEVGAAVPASLAVRLSRSDRMALGAAHEAWQASGIGETKLAPERIAVVVGGTTGGMLEAEDVLRRRRSGELARMPVRGLVGMPVATTADVLAHVFGCDGVRHTAVTACSSSANALGLAADWIHAGRADAALAGGTDSLCHMTYAGFNALQALAPDVPAVRPPPRRPLARRGRRDVRARGGSSRAATRRCDPRRVRRLRRERRRASPDRAAARRPRGRARHAPRAPRSAASRPTRSTTSTRTAPARRRTTPIETRAIKEVFGAHAGGSR